MAFRDAIPNKKNNFKKKWGKTLSPKHYGDKQKFNDNEISKPVDHNAEESAVKQDKKKQWKTGGNRINKQWTFLNSDKEEKKFDEEDSSTTKQNVGKKNKKQKAVHVKEECEIPEENAVNEAPKKNKKKHKKEIVAEDNVTEDIKYEVKEEQHSNKRKNKDRNADENPSPKKSKLMRKSMRKRKEIAGLDIQPELMKFVSKSEDSSEDIDDAEDKDINDPEDKDINDPEDKDINDPEDKEIIDAEDNDSDQDSDDSTEENPTKRPKKAKKQSMPDPPEKQNRTLFFGNMPIAMSKADVERVFKPYGKIESIRFRSVVPTKLSIPKKVANIKHKYNENSTSLKGFVVYEKPEDAEAALCLNGTVVNGHHIRVDKAGFDSQYDIKATVFVGNLPFTIQDEELWNAFSDCGNILNVRVIRDKVHGMGKGFAFVRFETEAAVQEALALNDTAEINGRKIRVKLSEVQKPAENAKTNSPKKEFKTQDGRGGGKPRGKFPFKKFQKGKKGDQGSRKTLKKMQNKRKQAHEKKKIASLFNSKPKSS